MGGLVPSEAQIKAFEALEQGHVESLFAPGLLTGEQIITGLLLRLSQQNDALYQALTGRTSPVTAPAPSVTPRFIVPFDIRSFNRLFVVSQAFGDIVTGAVTFNETVAAGSSVSTSSTSPSGTTTLILDDLTSATSAVSASVGLSVELDGKTTASSDYPLIANPQRIPLEAYYYFQDDILFKVTNNTAANVTVSGIVPIAQVNTESVFRKFYLPIIQASVAALKTVANEQVQSS